MQPHERIYVAVDTSDVLVATKLVRALKGKVGGFKIGLEFIMSMFAQLMRGEHAHDRLDHARELFELIGENLFLDGKFDDIKNTVIGATLGIAPLTAKFFNIHASAGVPALEAAAANRGQSQVLAVTLLTSFDEIQCRTFFVNPPSGIVPAWAFLAAEAGVHGLICSPADLAMVNRNPRLTSVPKMTPGIRGSWSPKDDQARTLTPAQAIAAGATWLVVGRPITQYPEGPVKAVERIVDEIASVS